MRKNLATSKRNYENFEQEFFVSLDNHAPYKSKQTQANQVSHMTKNLRKIIIKRSQLKTKYYKTNTAEILRLYKKQKNFSSELYKKEIKKYCNSLRPNKVTDNKSFWKTINPFLSLRRTNINKITLSDNDKVILDNKQLCEIFSNFFQEVVKTIGVSGSFNV